MARGEGDTRPTVPVGSGEAVSSLEGGVVTEGEGVGKKETEPTILEGEALAETEGECEEDTEGTWMLAVGRAEGVTRGERLALAVEEREGLRGAVPDTHAVAAGERVGDSLKRADTVARRSDIEGARLGLADLLIRDAEGGTEEDAEPVAGRVGVGIKEERMDGEGASVRETDGEGAVDRERGAVGLGVGVARPALGVSRIEGVREPEPRGVTEATELRVGDRDAAGVAELHPEEVGERDTAVLRDWVGEAQWDAEARGDVETDTEGFRGEGEAPLEEVPARDAMALLEADTEAVFDGEGRGERDSRALTLAPAVADSVRVSREVPEFTRLAVTVRVVVVDAEAERVLGAVPEGGALARAEGDAVGGSGVAVALPPPPRAGERLAVTERVDVVDAVGTTDAEGDGDGEPLRKTLREAKGEGVGEGEARGVRDPHADAFGEGDTRGLRVAVTVRVEVEEGKADLVLVGVRVDEREGTAPDTARARPPAAATPTGGGAARPRRPPRMEPAVTPTHMHTHSRKAR